MKCPKCGESMKQVGKFYFTCTKCGHTINVLSNTGR